MTTAILVDGAFFLHQYKQIFGREPGLNEGQDSPEVVAKNLCWMCFRHLEQKGEQSERSLYRIFFYDCPPLTKRAHNPIGKRAIDFSKTAVARFRIDLHEELKRQRKLALRLGHLDEGNAAWQLKPQVQKALFKGERDWPSIGSEDVVYYARQKGVDMRIGLDIASMAYKQHVDQIILVAGDSDFVPAAKLARREGIDFVLDSMRHPIRADLHEHIDGLRSIRYEARGKSKKRSVVEGTEVVTEPAKRGNATADKSKSALTSAKAKSKQTAKRKR